MHQGPCKSTSLKEVVVTSVKWQRNCISHKLITSWWGSNNKRSKAILILTRAHRTFSMLSWDRPSKSMNRHKSNLQHSKRTRWLWTFPNKNNYPKLRLVMVFLQENKWKEAVGSKIRLSIQDRVWPNWTVYSCKTSWVLIRTMARVTRLPTSKMRQPKTFNSCSTTRQVEQKS